MSEPGRSMLLQRKATPSWYNGSFSTAGQFRGAMHPKLQYQQGKFCASVNHPWTDRANSTRFQLGQGSGLRRDIVSPPAQV